MVNSKVLFSNGEMGLWGDTNFKAFSLGVGKVLKDNNLIDGLEMEPRTDLEKDDIRIGEIMVLVLMTVLKRLE